MGCRRFAPLASFAVLLTACAATPDIAYVADGDAGADATATADGSSGGLKDAALDAPQGQDGAADAGGADGATGCATGTPPAGADRCCGAVPCVDRSGNGCNCADCAPLGCSAWCCIGGNQKVSCKANASSCR